MTTTVVTTGDVITVIDATAGPQGPRGEQGLQGIQGIQGEPGRSFTMRGTVPTDADLPAIGNEVGDAYVTVDDGHLFVWDGEAFVDGGQIRGPQGIQGIQGEVGDTGNAFTLRGTVPTAADLPASSNEAGDAYVTLDDGHLYAWNGAAWIDGGQIRGPQGLQGLQGLQGFQGIQGIQGEPGHSFTYRGTRSTEIALPSDAVQGDAYRLLDTEHLWIYNGVAWVDAGPFRGPQGPQGEQGAGLTILGSVATAADLPTSDNEAGNGWIANDTGHLWVWNGSEWIDAGEVRGPPGPPATPGGANTYIQFNDAGAFNGVAQLVFDKATNTLRVGSDQTGNGTITAPQGLGLNQGADLFIEAGKGGPISGNGGYLLLRGGDPVTSGHGGHVEIRGRNGRGANGNGGNAIVRGGQRTGTGTPGAVELNGDPVRVNGVNLNDAAHVTAGRFNVARLGSGDANVQKVLRGNGAWTDQEYWQVGNPAANGDTVVVGANTTLLLLSPEAGVTDFFVQLPEPSEESVYSGRRITLVTHLDDLADGDLGVTVMGGAQQVFGGFVTLTASTPAEFALFGASQWFRTV